MALPPRASKDVAHRIKSGLQHGYSGEERLSEERRGRGARAGHGLAIATKLPGSNHDICRELPYTEYLRAFYSRIGRFKTV